MADHELSEGDAGDTADVRSGAHSSRQGEQKTHGSMSMDFMMRNPSLFGVMQPTSMRNLGAQIQIDLANTIKQIDGTISRPQALGFAMGPSLQNQMIEQLRTSQSRLLRQISADIEKSISSSLESALQIGKMPALDKTWAEARPLSHVIRALDDMAFQNLRVIQMHSAEVLRRNLTDLQQLPLDVQLLDLVGGIEDKHAYDRAGQQLERDQDLVRSSPSTDIYDATEMASVEIPSHSLQPFQRAVLLYIISEIAWRMIVDQIAPELIEVLAAYVRLLMQLAFEGNVIQSDILSPTITETLLVEAEASTLSITD